jgi:hypothetical protein
MMLMLITLTGCIDKASERLKWVFAILDYLLDYQKKADILSVFNKKQEAEGQIEQQTEGEFGKFEEESNPAFPVMPGEGSNEGSGDLTLKPVGFVNYGSVSATVSPWIYIPLGGNEPQTPPDVSTVSSAQGGGGDWPNSSRFISVPLGTYTWCIEWEEDDQDGDGYFDYYHYFEEGPTVLDENDSDDLDLAEEVLISTPPANAPIYDGKCGETGTTKSNGTYIGYVENVEFTLVINFVNGRVSGTIHFDDAEIYGEEGWYWGDADITGKIDLASYMVTANWTGNCGSHYHEITELWSGTIEGYISADQESFSGTYFDDDGTTVSFEAERQ